MNKWSIQIPLSFDRPKVLFFNVERSGKDVHSKSISNFEDLTKKDKYLYANLNELWHDVEEEPEKCAWIISECDSGYRSIDWGNVTSGLWYGWDGYVSYYGVRRWAYIDAILPED